MNKTLRLAEAPVTELDELQSWRTWETKHNERLKEAMTNYELEQEVRLLKTWGGVAPTDTARYRAPVTAEVTSISQITQDARGVYGYNSHYGDAEPKEYLFSGVQITFGLHGKHIDKVSTVPAKLRKQLEDRVLVMKTELEALFLVTAGGTAALTITTGINWTGWGARITLYVPPTNLQRVGEYTRTLNRKVLSIVHRHMRFCAEYIRYFELMKRCM